jgi:hypothetical protein
MACVCWCCRQQVVSLLSRLPESERKLNMLLGISDASSAAAAAAGHGGGAGALHDVVARHMVLRSTSSGPPVLVASGVHEVRRRACC